MKDLFVVLLILGAAYVFIRLMLKEPILPFGEKKVKSNIAKDKPTNNRYKNKKNSKEKHIPLEEDEAAPFRELFPNLVDFQSHMIRSGNNEFTMIAEVEPVNYFLRDHEEQEIIDGSFETWTATINYPVRIYLQNRFVDLSEEIASIKKTMQEQDDLNIAARDYGENMIRDLEMWQRSQPRYELKRFILFDYQVEVKDLKYDPDAEDLDEVIVEKAFNELHRRVESARSTLRRGEMIVQLLSTDGLIELSYYTFNRRKAVKNKYRDVANKEQLALYVTADQSAEHIAAVKGEIERHVQNEKEKIS